MGVRLTARDFSLCNHYADKKSGVINLMLSFLILLVAIIIDKGILGNP